MTWDQWRRELAEKVDNYIQLQSDGEGDDEAYNDLKAHILTTPFDTVQRWKEMAHQQPDAGRMIVKRWKNGSVWAGMYTGAEKERSFDFWVYLP